MLGSILWSIDTYLTARWSVLLLATTLYAVYLFLRSDLAELLTLFAVASFFWSGGVCCNGVQLPSVRTNAG
ncbi:MAG: hypothetical protein R2706_07750 [Acidimicrobiales bacterium]